MMIFLNFSAMHGVLSTINDHASASVIDEHQVTSPLLVFIIDISFDSRKHFRNVNSFSVMKDFDIVIREIEHCLELRPYNVQVLFHVQ